MADTFMDWVTGLLAPGPRLPAAGDLGLAGVPRLPTAEALGLGGMGARLPSFDTLGPLGVGAGQDRLYAPSSLKEQQARNQPWIKEEQDRQQAQQQQRGQFAGQQVAPTVARAAGLSSQAGSLAQQITGMAADRYGPAAGQVVSALLTAEGGLGGAVGDKDISPVGSHGPFQFYGPGGQLDNYARARGLSLEQAGQQARDNPLDAAQYALDTYIGQALRAGTQAGETGEPLLRRVLAAQNPGALNSPTHYQRYTQALQGAAQQTAPAAPQGTMTIRGQQVPLPTIGNLMAGRPGGQAPQAPQAVAAAPVDASGYAFPVVGYQGQISAHHGSVRGGSDLMAPEGTPVVAMRGGTVLSAGNDRTGGNFVLVQGDDGNQYYYAHLRDAPLVGRGPLQVGQPLGFVGRTGNAANTPPHLHLGIGPSIVNGVGPLGGTGGDFDAIALMVAALAAANAGR